MEKKIEVIYYEMLKMEKRLEEKAKVIFEARESIEKALNRFEILQKELLQKLDNT